LPLGRGRSLTRHLRKAPIDLSQFWTRDAAHRVVDAKCFDVADQCLPEIVDCFLLGVSLAVGGNVRQPGREPAEFFVGDEFDGKLLSGLPGEARKI